MTPVERNSRASGERTSASVASSWTSPMQKDPTRFTASVPNGNSGPNQRTAATVVRYRSALPAAPPSATSTTCCTAASADRGPVIGPGHRRLERGGRGEHRALPVTPPDDLQADRQPGGGEARGHGRGGLAGEVERIRERDPAERRDRLSVDLLHRGLPDGKRRHGHRRREQEIESHQEPLDLGPQLLATVHGGEVAIDRDREPELEDRG